MKYSLLIFTLFTFTLLSGQEKEFNPTLLYFPSINPDSIAKFEKQKQDFNDIVGKKIKYDKNSSYHRFLMENEMMFYNDGFSTSEEGCSWYCAGGPSNISTSSTLKSQGSNSYDAENLHDFNLKTAWVEGTANLGIGEEIVFEFQMVEQLKVTHLEIYNGYCKNEKSWRANGRVKTLGLYINNKYEGNLNLKDSYYCQRFEVGSFGCKKNEKMTISLKIIDVYPGDKYSDVAISEINFDGTGDH